MSNRTKKQHYIAQCLLKIFVVEDEIWDCIINNKKVFKSNFEDCMCQKNLYEINYLKDNTLENFFASRIDEKTANLNRKIIEILDKKDNLEEVYADIMDNIHLYLINYYKTITSLTRFSIEGNVATRESIVSMLSRIANKDYLERLGTILKECYKFCIIKSLNGDFVLCDQYLSTCSTKYKGMYSNISSRDIGIKDTMIFIPLNRYYYIVFYDNDNVELKLIQNKINSLNEKQVKMINEIIYSNAYKKVISHKKEILENLEKQNTNIGDVLTMIGRKSGSSVMHRVKSEVFLTKEQVKLYKYYESLKWGNPIYKKCLVNDKCPCESNKKYKKCCKKKVDECWYIYENQISHKNILIDEKLGSEKVVSIGETYGKC